jgi:hemerythrin superfamily protein
MASDVVDLIMQDHREVERLFDELRDTPEKRPNLVPVLTTLLIAHSRAEEAEVYPVAAAEAGEADDVAHSQEEHVQAEKLLEQLAGADPESSAFDDMLKDLVDAVTHHVEEEESKVLPGMRDRLSESRLAELGEAFAAARRQHLGEQPEDTTREDLLQQARNAGVSGTSGLSKEELKQKLQSEAEE